jgi:CspA family cold shock protein
MTNDKKNINVCNIECIEAIVKWYNPEKGYGFLVRQDKAEDIMIHFSVLDMVGCPYVQEGDKVMCDIVPGKAGWQVFRVRDIKFGSPGPRSLFSFLGSRVTPFNPEDLEEIEGVLKWYNSKKGYGFVYPKDGGQEIFLHSSVLRAAGYKYLEPGVRVSVKVSKSDKGQEARILSLLSDENEKFTETYEDKGNDS